MAKFRLQRLRGGRKHVLTTDSAADYLRCLIDEMAGDFSVLCHVTVTELTVVPAAPGASGAGGVGGTPQAQWIPRPFNGGTFYLIPCDKSESTMSTAIVSPRPAAAEATHATVKVDWGLLTRPTTQPSATVTP